MKKTAVIVLTSMISIFSGSVMPAADQMLVGISAENTMPDSYVSQMTREEKVGQLLLISPSQMCSQGDWTDNIEEVLQNMKNYFVGGLVFFAEDLRDPEAVRTLILQAKEQSKLPILTVMDESGSLTEGFSGRGKLQIQESDSSGDPAEGTGESTIFRSPSEEWKQKGILLEAAPGRPGEGEAEEGIAVGENADPAFSGVLLTDSLSIADGQESYGGTMAVMQALQNGADMLTAPPDVLTAYYGIHSAIDEQLVTEEQIDASVEKILALKRHLDPEGNW